MAVEIVVKLDIKEKLKKELNSPAVLQPIGDKIVLEMKRLIAAGVSPVTGDRFPAYKAVDAVRYNKKEAARAKKNALHSDSHGEDHNTARELAAHQAHSEKAAEALHGYPYSVKGKFPDKAITPVNLWLSGKMQSFLRAIGRNGGLEIGYIDAPDDVEVYARAHNEGPTNQAFAQRQTIPIKKGEEFTRTVMSKLNDLYSKALSDILGKSK